MIRTFNNSDSRGVVIGEGRFRHVVSLAMGRTASYHKDCTTRVLARVVFGRYWIGVATWDTEDPR